MATASILIRGEALGRLTYTAIEFNTLRLALRSAVKMTGTVRKKEILTEKDSTGKKRIQNDCGKRNIMANDAE
uniref:Uncharacterized protein n=1 Tax=Ascaris lumbricoides TaxID=6252 RepID=A0A0M3HZ68_ASCLU